MRIEHIAIWTRSPEGLERLRTFYETYFGASAGSRYQSTRRPGFVSYFLELPAGGAPSAARLELMTAPGIAPAATGRETAGYAHLAISLGSRAAVDALVARMAADGVPVLSGPRVTGDDYYEAVVHDPDGNLVEIIA
jgi:lactoylglutathione lyase